MLIKHQRGTETTREERMVSGEGWSLGWEPGWGTA